MPEAGPALHFERYADAVAPFANVKERFATQRPPLIDTEFPNTHYTYEVFDDPFADPQPPRPVHVR